MLNGIAMNYDLFNGDADGICALLQLRKSEPLESELVTGVKRDINLLAKIEAGAGDRVTVLDVSMDKNKQGLEAMLSAGASVFYVDHHKPGDIPDNQNLTAIINEAPDVCTAALVNNYLKGAHLDWAVTGAFGDNLKDTARTLAKDLDISSADLTCARRSWHVYKLQRLWPSYRGSSLRSKRTLFESFCSRWPAGFRRQFARFSQAR